MAVLYRWGKENGTVKDCKFVDCTASNGGAVYWNSANGTVKGSTFENCTASNGGAVSWFYNGINGNVSNSTFVNCTATTNGGAVDWRGIDGVLDNCSFKYSSAKNGGAVYWNQYGTNGTVRVLTFESLFGYCLC